MLKVLHFADVHTRDKDIGEIEKCLKYIVKKAKEEQPDIIIDAGDTFDSRHIKMDSQSAKMIFGIFQELADIAPVAIVMGTPHHDGTTTEVLKYIKAKYPIYVASRPEQILLAGGRFGTDLSEPELPAEFMTGAIISLCPAPTKQFFGDAEDSIKDTDVGIADAMSSIFAGFAAQAEAYNVPHILVGHWNTTGSLISETQTLIGVDIEISKDQMALANADIVCLGHIHKNQQIGDNIFYSGGVTSLTWGEMDVKGFYIHAIPSNGLPFRSYFIDTPSTKRIKIHEDLTVGNAVDLVNIAFYPITPGELADAHVKIEFEVFQDEAAKIDLEKIKKYYLSEGASKVEIRVNYIPRENVRSQTILKLTTLREKLIEQARLKGETVKESILTKADLMEGGEA